MYEEAIIQSIERETAIVLFAGLWNEIHSQVSISTWLILLIFDSIWVILCSNNTILTWDVFSNNRFLTILTISLRSLRSWSLELFSIWYFMAFVAVNYNSTYSMNKILLEKMIFLPVTPYYLSSSSSVSLDSWFIVYYIYSPSRFGKSTFIPWLIPIGDSDSWLSAYLLSYIMLHVWSGECFSKGSQ